TLPLTPAEQQFVQRMHEVQRQALDEIARGDHTRAYGQSNPQKPSHWRGLSALDVGLADCRRATPRSPAASSSPLPLVFEENRGQADPRVKFLARGAGYVAVDGERYGDDLTAPTRDQEDIRAPALIQGRLSDLAEMRAPVAAVDPRRQHQAVQLHDAPN